MIKVVYWFISNMIFTNIHQCTCCWPVTPEDAHIAEVWVPTFCTLRWHPTHQNAASHSVWQGSARSHMGRGCGAAGRLLAVWNQCWYFCFFNQSSARIFLFKSLPVLSNVLQVLINLGFVSISLHFFLLANLQTSLFASQNFLQIQKLDEAAYNWLHWKLTDITMNMSWFCSNW